MRQRGYCTAVRVVWKVVGGGGPFLVKPEYITEAGAAMVGRVACRRNLHSDVNSSIAAILEPLNKSKPPLPAPPAESAPVTGTPPPHELTILALVSS
jgi:hypothetical protein